MQIFNSFKATNLSFIPVLFVLPYLRINENLTIFFEN